MVVIRVVVFRVLVLRKQNFLIPASGGIVSVVVVRTQNFLSSSARGSSTSGSGARGSGTKAKFSKSSRAC